MFIDKRNLYSVLLLSGILILVLFFSSFSFLEELETTTSNQATVKTPETATATVTPPETTTETTTSTNSPVNINVSAANEDSSKKKLTSVNANPTISTETIIKISDIQNQTNNLGIIIQTDIVNLSKEGLKIIQNPSIVQALSTISDKSILTAIDNVINDGQKVYMNLLSQNNQIKNNLTQFTKQYQNLNL